MPELLLTGELESTDWVAECLDKVERDLREMVQSAGRTAEKMKGTAHAFENAWREIVVRVAKGQTSEMQAVRPELFRDFETRLRLLKQAHSLLTGLHKRERIDLDPDFLLREIAEMQQLQARVFDLWQSSEDLEDLAARDYPLTQEELDRIGPQRPPPASWYAEEGKPF